MLFTIFYYFGLGKKNSSYFPLHNVGRSALSILPLSNIIWSAQQTPEYLPICQWRHWPRSWASL